jgi:hypothetical protein
MTFRGLLISLFPLAMVVGSGASVVFAFWCREPWLFAVAFAFLYVLPVLCFRIHQLIAPIKMGGSHLAGKGYSGWYGGHQIQLLYLYLPILERLLRMLPGVFSLWLRLWGAKVGKGIYWTPHFEVSDRSLLSVGDKVIFGHRVTIVAHLIKPTRKNLLLYVKPVEIGSQAFIGAGTVIGPGVTVKDGAFVAIGSHLYPDSEAS